MIGGDLMHSPVQCMHPEWRARPDWDPELARKTRRAFMETHADLQSLVCMMHFPLPSAGKFERKGELFKFKYDEVDW